MLLKEQGCRRRYTLQRCAKLSHMVVMVGIHALDQQRSYLSPSPPTRTLEIQVPAMSCRCARD